MAIYNTQSSFVDTIVFEISPLKIDFTFRQSPSGQIEIKEPFSLREVKLASITRKARKIRVDTKVDVPQDSSYTQDSVRLDSNNVNKEESLHVEQLEREPGILIPPAQNNWMIGVLLFSFIIMAVTRFSFSKFLGRIVSSVFYHQTSNKLFLEKNMRNLRGAVFLNLLFFINFAMFVVQYLENLLPTITVENSFLFFIYCLLGLMVLYAGKFIIIRSVGYVLNGVKESKEYMHTVFIYNKNLGMALLPIIFSVPFISDAVIPLLLNIGLAITVILYLLRLFRGFRILFRQHVSIFYMILYLCGLEILPLLMIFKLVEMLA